VSNRFVRAHQLESIVAPCPVPTVRSVSSRRIRALADEFNSYQAPERIQQR